MGYFDFLGNVTPEEQDATPSRSQILTKPKKQQVDDRLPGAVDGESSPSDPSKIGPEDDGKRRAFMAKEESVVQAEQRALKNVHETLKMATTQEPEGGFTDGADPKILQVKDALDRGMLKPHQLMGDVETLLKGSKNFQTPGLAQSLSTSLNDLKVAAQQRQQLESERLNIKHRPQMGAQDLETGAQEAFSKAEELRKASDNEGVLSGSDKVRDARNFEAQGLSLKTQAEEMRQAMAPNVAEAPPAPTAQTQTTTNQYDKYFNGVNFPREQRVKAMADIIDQMGLDVDHEVDFKTGVWQILQEQFPEEIPSFIQYAMGQKPKSPEQALAEGGTPMPAGSAGDTGAQSGATAADPIEERKGKLRQLQAELSDAQELQSWPAIIAFALLSVILKPQGAFIFFSNAKKKGELGYLIREVKDDIAQLRREKHDKDVEQTAYRKMYVQQALTGKRQDDSQNKQFRQQILLTSLRGAQQIKAAKARAGQTDSILKGLEDSFHQATSMSGRYAATADFDKATEWNKKSEGIIKLITQRRMQLEKEKQPAQVQTQVQGP